MNKGDDVAKPQKKANLIRQQMVGGLIETKPASWERKTLAKDEDGKEIVINKRVTHQALRYPLAQNISDENVERIAKRWL
jgi:hypothetical protein